VAHSRRAATHHLCAGPGSAALLPTASRTRTQTAERLPGQLEKRCQRNAICSGQVVYLATKLLCCRQALDSNDACMLARAEAPSKGVETGALPAQCNLNHIAMPVALRRRLAPVARLRGVEP